MRNSSPTAKIAIGAAFFVLILFILIPSVYAAPFDFSKGIVPECSVTERTGGTVTGLQNMCTFCDFLVLFQRILNYMMFIVAPAVLAISLMWGGGLMFVSSIQGSPTLAQRGKKVIFNTLIGIVLVFGSWLIIDTVIKVLGGRIGSNTAAAPFGPWNEITCIAPRVDITLPPTAPPPPPPPGPSVGIEQELARYLLSRGLCSGSASCGGVNSCSSLSAVASGNPPPVCSSGCGPATTCPANGSVHLSTTMLSALKSMDEAGMRFTITSLTTGNHTGGSKHYQGKAVDIATRPGGPTYVTLGSALGNRGATLVQCEKSGVRVSCTDSAIDHVHAEFP